MLRASVLAQTGRTGPGYIRDEATNKRTVGVFRLNHLRDCAIIVNCRKIADFEHFSSNKLNGLLVLNRNSSFEIGLVNQI